MPIYKQNSKVGEIIDQLTDVDKRYRDKLVFQHFLPTGYALWTGPNGFISSYDDLQTAVYFSPPTPNAELLVNQSVPLNQPIAKLKTGLTINLNPKALVFWYRSSGNEWEFDDLTSFTAGGEIVTTTISKADLASQTPVKILAGTFQDVAVVAVDDTHIKFFNQPNGTTAPHEYQNSTLIGWNDANQQSASRAFAIIDSIIAY